jgi:nitrilase
MSHDVLRAAAVQMVSTPDLPTNLAAARRLIGEAAAQGAKLVALPEYFVQISSDSQAKLGIAEDFGTGPIQDMLAEEAARHGIWIAGGSMPLRTGDPLRVTNTLLVHDDAGRCVTRYDKCNLFSIQSEQVTHDENLTMIGGSRLAVAEHPWGRIGLAICYDVRFPTLFERLGPVNLILLPSAFTMPTGEAHWELLIRSRALDNQAYLLAPAQGGHHEAGRQTWGHSMAIDPWGRVMAVRDQGEGIIFADLQRAEIDRVRSTLPVVRDRLRNCDLEGVSSDA